MKEGQIFVCIKKKPTKNEHIEKIKKIPSFVHDNEEFIKNVKINQISRVLFRK